jgi:hypothetical protein
MSSGDMLAQFVIATVPFQPFNGSSLSKMISPQGLKIFILLSSIEKLKY